MTTHPETLVPGAKGPHGKHEDRCEGWDCNTRACYGYDDDAATRGRHAAIDTTGEVAA